MSRWGNCLLEGYGTARDEVAGIAWLGRAAESGDTDAQTALGLAYMQGQGVQRDRSRAKYWYEMAANQMNEEECRLRRSLKSVRKAIHTPKALPDAIVDTLRRVKAAWEPSRLMSTCSPPPVVVRRFQRAIDMDGCPSFGPARAAGAYARLGRDEEALRLLHLAIERGYERRRPLLDNQHYEALRKVKGFEEALLRITESPPGA